MKNLAGKFYGKSPLWRLRQDRRTVLKQKLGQSVMELWMPQEGYILEY
jgi:hypothetical protein